MAARSEQTASASQYVKATVTVVVIAVAVAIFVAILAWRSPLREYLNFAQPLEILEERDPSLVTGLIAVAGFIAGTFVFLPLLAIFTANVVVFGPMWGSVFSLTGAFTSGVLHFFLGRVLHTTIVNKVRAPIIILLRRKFSRSGPWPIAFLRIVPVAPFVVINLAAGALRMRATDFVFGNMLGVLVPVIAVGLLDYQMLRVTRTPNLKSFAITVLIIGTVVLLIMRIRRSPRSRPQ